MKHKFSFYPFSPLLLFLFLVSCTSTRNLNYLQNIPETPEYLNFTNTIPDYRVKFKDILYVKVEMMTPDGKIENVLQGSEGITQTYTQGESGSYLIGFNVDKEGNILIPVMGSIEVGGKTLPEIRDVIQQRVDSVFHHAYVEVKLFSFKYTILGEARSPGAYMSYNDYLTVLDAVGRAGGVGDYGRRDRVLVVRSTPDGSKTFRINLQDKNLLTSEAYFLQPNDIVIIEPRKQKIFNMNLPTISFIISTLTGTLTTTLLLINYFKK
jgi:polysaccharide biosynthesis/export protein